MCNDMAKKLFEFNEEEILKCKIGDILQNTLLEAYCEIMNGQGLRREITDALVVCNKNGRKQKILVNFICTVLNTINGKLQNVLLLIQPITKLY